MNLTSNSNFSVLGILLIQELDLAHRSPQELASCIEIFGIHNFSLGCLPGSAFCFAMWLHTGGECFVVLMNVREIL